MFDRFIWNIAISFVLRQIEKFRLAIDWTKVKADIDVRVRAIIPGNWFDDEISKAVLFLIDTIADVLKAQIVFDEILHLLALQKYEEAAKKVKDLLICAWSGGCAVPKAKELVLA